MKFALGRSVPLLARGRAVLELAPCPRPHECVHRQPQHPLFDRSPAATAASTRGGGEADSVAMGLGLKGHCSDVSCVNLFPLQIFHTSPVTLLNVAHVQYKYAHVCDTHALLLAYSQRILRLEHS